MKMKKTNWKIFSISILVALIMLGAIVHLFLSLSSYLHQPVNSSFLKTPQIRDVYKVIDKNQQIDAYKMQKQILQNVGNQIQPKVNSSSDIGDLHFSYHYLNNQFVWKMQYEHNQYEWHYYLQNGI